MAENDCQAIEQHIKDILFHSIPGNKSAEHRYQLGSTSSRCVESIADHLPMTKEYPVTRKEPKTRRRETEESKVVSTAAPVYQKEVKKNVFQDQFKDLECNLMKYEINLESSSSDKKDVNIKPFSTEMCNTDPLEIQVRPNNALHHMLMCDNVKSQGLTDPNCINDCEAGILPCNRTICDKNTDTNKGEIITFTGFTSKFLPVKEILNCNNLPNASNTDIQKESLNNSTNNFLFSEVKDSISNTQNKYLTGVQNAEECNVCDSNIIQPVSEIFPLKNFVVDSKKQQALKKQKKKERKKKNKNKCINEIRSNAESNIVSIMEKTDDICSKFVSTQVEKYTDQIPVKSFERKDALSTHSDNLSEDPSAHSASHNPTMIKMKKDFFTSHVKEYVITMKKGQLHFFCYICDLNCVEASAIMKHITSPNHKILKQAKEEEGKLYYLPFPLPVQIECISEVITDVAVKYGLSEDEIKERRSVVKRLNEIIAEHIPACSIELVGSSASGFALKDSEIDIVLKVLPEQNAADILANIYDLMKEENSYSNVYSEFRKKIPQIKFTDSESGKNCNISIDNGTVSQVTKLLSDYASLDPRIRVLGTVFRYWAKLCEVDQQDKGTLPSFCFPLLLVYFLQQQKPPVLPVLHEMAGNLCTDDFIETCKLQGKWKSQNTASVGELWIKLMRFYSIEYRCGEDVVCIRSLQKVSCKEKNWGTKILAIEDPFVRRNLAHVIPNHQLFRYIRDCFRRTYQYFAYPQLQSGPLSLTSEKTSLNNMNERDISATYATGEISSLHLDHVECLTEEETDLWEHSELSDTSFTNEKLLDLEDHFEDHDPELCFEDVVSTVNKLTLDDFVVSNELDDEDEASLLDSNADSKDDINENDRLILSMDVNLIADNVTRNSRRDANSPELKNDTKEKQQDMNEEASELSNECSEPKLIYYWDVKEIIVKNDLVYYFHKKIFKGDKSPPLVCRLCQRHGHLKKNCPEEKLPDIFALPKMTPEFMKCLNKMCEQILKENQPASVELQCRNMILLGLQTYIKEIFPDANLQMFGSFCNGFGFTRSDMDICLTFENNNTGKGLDYVKIIEKLAASLKRNPSLLNVIPITSAKVPIVKFVHRETSLEGDISLYNTLAQYNTRMLDTYCRIDHRVQILGYALKYFAKVLGIGDASRGSLSSYAYILMTIFFLQQRKPPVIPVLQELYTGSKPNVTVDDWNAWFYNDLENLPKDWPEHGKNKETAGELWLGLLCFYAEEFDFNEYVISIRQKKLLTRFKKLWNSKRIAIEDPFDLSHNLGSGLSRRMNNYILRAFIRGRERFGSPMSIEQMQKFSGREMDYLFDRYVLTGGKEPPNDRGCRSCGKIGHLVKNCPRRRPNKSDLCRPNRHKNRNADLRQEISAVFGNKLALTDTRREVGKRTSPMKHGGCYLPINLERCPDIQAGGQNQLPSGIQRFPVPGSHSVSSQHLQFGCPPFAILPHQSCMQRPVTSSPFPINGRSFEMALSPPKSSLTQQTASGIKQQQKDMWLSNLRQSLPQQDDINYSPGFSNPNRYNLDSGHQSQRGRHRSGNNHLSHHQSTASQRMHDHPRQNLDTSSHYQTRWQ